MVCEQSGPMQNNGEIIVVGAVQRSISPSTAALPNDVAAGKHVSVARSARNCQMCLQLN